MASQSAVTLPVSSSEVEPGGQEAMLGDIQSSSRKGRNSEGQRDESASLGVVCRARSHVRQYPQHLM